MKKIPFDLNKWLQDKSYKVETRDGRSVRIASTEGDPEYPITAFITITREEGCTSEFMSFYDAKGHHSLGSRYSHLDLFLIDENEPETEFEKAVFKAIQGKEYSKELCDTLLSIARKQLSKK